MPKVTLTCEACGDGFDVYPCREDSATYCSRECMADGYSKPEPEYGAEATCETCGETFGVPPVREDEAKYCSHECYGESINRHDEKWETVKCKACDDDFEALTSRDREYCSSKCWSVGQQRRVTLECPICGDDFESVEANADLRVCCSRECMGEYRSEHYVGENHHKFKPRAEIECKNCGDIFKVTQARADIAVYCSRECMAEDYDQGGTAYGPGWTPAKKKRVRENYGFECDGCGMSQEDHIKQHGKRLHVHHKIKANEYDEDDPKKNEEWNLVPLCQDCHWTAEAMAPLYPFGG